MVLDQWVHSRIALAKNPLAECRALLVDTPHLGSLPGSTYRPSQTNYRIPSGCHYHRVDDRCVDQQRIVDTELAAALSRLVSGGDGAWGRQRFTCCAEQKHGQQSAIMLMEFVC